MGYSIAGFALLLLVQSKNIYPQLLLTRLLFSLGGSATATMVTAILPMMVSPRSKHGEFTSGKLPRSVHSTNTSPTTSESTHAPTKGDHHQDSGSISITSVKPLPTRLAGIVGLFTGCGALLALSLFLPLPKFFQSKGFLPGTAVQYSFYVVGLLAFIVALFCFFGLRNLSDRAHDQNQRGAPPTAGLSGTTSHFVRSKKFAFLGPLFKSIALSYQHPEFCLSYVGGFVARASSVGITLFIPLYVNAYFKNSGLCDGVVLGSHNTGKHCQDAYILAAKLTGVSQLMALIFAPIFGYLAERYRRFNVPLLAAASTGILGYIAMTFLDSPDPQAAGGSNFIYLIVSLLGISQIGAIVCSLGLLGHSVLELASGPDGSGRNGEPDDDHITPLDDCLDELPDPLLADGHTNSITEEMDEESRLLYGHHRSELGSYEYMKGSIAGVYSLAGGAGILVLTKTGGLLFDRVSSVGPFYLLAVINGFLLLVGIGCIVISLRREK